MLIHVYTRAKNYFSRHIILNSVAHTAGGFGLAVLLQQYVVGDPFVSMWVGWALVALSVVVHIRAMVK